MENKYNIWLIVVIIGLISVLIYTNLKNENNTPSQITKTLVKSDTVCVVDTVTKYYPKPIEVKVVDTMYIPIDSVKTEGDSILLPRETKTYEDSTYRAVVSGYKPSLDTLMVFPRTIYITKEKVREIEKKQRWNYSVGVGFGYGLVHRKFDIYAGFTVGYTF